MAGRQGSEGVMWSEMLRDGNSVTSLLREHLGARELGFESAVGELGWEKGRGMSSHEGLREASGGGVWAGCMGACTLVGYVRRCGPGHLERRTAGEGACEGRRLLESQKIMHRALGGKLQRGWERGTGGTQGCILAQIAPSAKTRHLSGRSGRTRGWEREGLELSRIRGT